MLQPMNRRRFLQALGAGAQLLSVPFVEVHLSDLEAREEWRRHSVIADLAATRILGKGADGYRDALQLLKEKLGA